MRLLLEKPFVYQLFSLMVGAKHSRSVYVNNFVKPEAGDKILDIGCGPADILDHLPKVDYYGFDISPSYIDAAIARHGENGHFYCERVSEAKAFIEQANTFDIALATGVLHHLDDAEATGLFEIAKRALAPGGRLVTFDGAYVDGQSRIARYFLSRDRGQYVRSPEAYAALASRVFGKVDVSIHHNLLRIPYTHVILECAR
jgi:SAM-dependent methyltransferase